MNFYLMIFMMFAIIYSSDLYVNNKKSIIREYKFLISSFTILLLTLILGLRDTLGSDYGSYYLDFLYMQEEYAEKNYFKTQALDPLYELLSFSIIFFNLHFDFLMILISLIIISSFVFFSNQEKDYLLIILIFLSYYYLILGMGYLRQGLSISFLLIFIHFWRNEKNFLSYIFLILAILSHKFAIVSSFLIFVRPNGNWFYLNKYFYIFVSIVLIYSFYKIFEIKNITDYFEVYSLEHSSGALYRTLGGAICSLLFFSKKSHFKNRSDYRYIYLSSLILLTLFPVSLIYSTISDRILAYFFPCILLILANLPYSFKKISPPSIKFLLLTVLFLHLFVWTNFSNQSRLYLPYRMVDYPGAKESPYIGWIVYCCEVKQITVWEGKDRF